MKSLLLLSLFFISLYGRNPYPYATLGDVIYDNAKKVQALEKIPEFSLYSLKIKKYMKDIKSAKKEGFKLESGKSKEKKAYLQKLRNLAKEYDFFRHLVETSYKKALKDDDVVLVYALINSGLLDTKRYKQEILDFYFEHMDTMPTKGLIQSYLDEDAKLRKKRAQERKRHLNKRQKELERIKRIREADRREQERLEEQLQKELLQKKKEIREYQLRELSKTI